MHKLLHVVVVFFLFVPVASARELIPMGQTVQIDLEMPHYVVVQDVYLDSGEWLKKGDKILTINNKPVSKLDQLPFEESKLKVERQGKEQSIQVSKQEMTQLSQFIRNHTTGLGTLTYIDPDAQQFGALGHQIIDQTLGIAPRVYRGALYIANVEKIKKSEPGIPGYKVSQHRQQLAIGDVDTNEVYGIFGKWQQPLQQSLPPARKIIHGKKIEVGPAILQTSIAGEKVEQFAIQINEITGETFRFTIEDASLIEKTGGIIQGMSGSPIIQNDNFVGAVTHMFVETPTKGAAISIVEMIKRNPK